MHRLVRRGFAGTQTGVGPRLSEWIRTGIGAMQRAFEFLASGLQHLFRRRTPDDVQLGQVLVERGIISQKQLEAALAAQRRRLIDTGQAVRLGHMITELGLASEAVVVQAINENFRISVASLSDNIRELISHQRGTLAERLPAPAIPIWLKLCIGALILVTVTIVSFSYFIIHRQKAQLFDQTVTVGTVSLNYFVNNARIPLIDDDILNLNPLIKEATATEGLRYAVVTDNHGLIRAHTDVDRIGTALASPTPMAAPVIRGDISYFSFTAGSGEQMLNLTREVIFQDKILGAVHVGVSLDFIERLVDKEKGFIIYVTVVMITVGLAIAVQDAHTLTKEHAHWITPSNGGRGAAREVCEMLMKSQDKLQAALEAYLV